MALKLLELVAQGDDELTGDLGVSGRRTGLVDLTSPPELAQEFSLLPRGRRFGVNPRGFCSSSIV